MSIHLLHSESSSAFVYAVIGLEEASVMEVFSRVVTMWDYHLPQTPQNRRSRTFPDSQLLSKYVVSCPSTNNASLGTIMKFDPTSDNSV